MGNCENTLNFSNIIFSYPKSFPVNALCNLGRQEEASINVKKSIEIDKEYIGAINFLSEIEN